MTNKNIIDVNKMVKSIIPIIMAGGLGKRMESDIPKVIHKLNGIPLIVHILLKLVELNNIIKLDKILIVVGKYKDQIKNVIDEYVILPNIIYVNQEVALGTGHAIQCCKNELTNNPNSDVLILSGDVPMLSTTTMLELISKTSNTKMIIANMENPTGYGRIVTQNGLFCKIVEQKDCNEEEMLITKVNTGIYCINSHILCKYLHYIKNNNNQKEYYLTDIVEIIKREENIQIDMLEIENNKLIEVTGINTIQQLKELESIIKKIENK